MSEPGTFSKGTFGKSLRQARQDGCVASLHRLASIFVSLWVLNYEFLSLSVDEFGDSSLSILMGLTVLTIEQRRDEQYKCGVREFPVMGKIHNIREEEGGGEG